MFSRFIKSLLRSGRSKDDEVFKVLFQCSRANACVTHGVSFKLSVAMCV